MPPALCRLSALPDKMYIVLRKRNRAPLGFEFLLDPLRDVPPHLPVLLTFAPWTDYKIDARVR